MDETINAVFGAIKSKMTRAGHLGAKIAHMKNNVDATEQGEREKFLKDLTATARARNNELQGQECLPQLTLSKC